MPDALEFLQQVDHRPWPLPASPWSYYQEWNDVLFLHWKVPAHKLTDMLPKGLAVDTINNHGWLSLVLFTMHQIHPRHLPAVSAISTFQEINVRTYVVKDNKAGVYFLSIEAEKSLSALLARMLSGLPYMKSTIKHHNGAHSTQRYAFNKDTKSSVDVQYRIGQEILEKSQLDVWLTERYCLYHEQHKSLYRFDTHHCPWVLNHVEMINLEAHYRVGHLTMTSMPDAMHYSSGVKVLSWGKTRVS